MWRGGFFGKKLVRKCNKRGVEGGINLKGKSTNVEGGNCVWRMDFFSKSVNESSLFLERWVDLSRGHTDPI